MNVREAILKAADHIEVAGRDYRFWAFDVPGAGCGTPACMVGWIGYFLDMAPGTSNNVVKSAIARGHDRNDFYEIIDSLGGFKQACLGRDDPQPPNADVARALRLYADKYHPAEKRGMPDSVRAIFETEQERVA